MTFLRVILLALVLPLAATGAATAAMKPLVVLMPGAGGPVAADFLMRNRDAFRKAGFDTQVITVSRAAANVINGQSHKRLIYIIGVDRGARQVAEVLRMSIEPAAAVLVSGDYDGVIQTLGIPDLMPQTLVVHHQSDRCEATPPDQALTLRAWADGKVRIAWMSTAGPPQRNACGPHGAHGFYQIDAPVIAEILDFLMEQ